MAKGYGLAGEAGPEAIMPLTRTRTGDLGVKATGGGTVNVYVTNNTRSQIEVSRGYNARGERDIFINIEEAIAVNVMGHTGPLYRALKIGCGITPVVGGR